MRKLLVSTTILAVLSVAACVLSPTALADNAIEVRKSSLGNNSAMLNAAEDKTLTPEERAAMQFLYAYMSDPDMAGYSPEFYLENVRRH